MRLVPRISKETGARLKLVAPIVGSMIGLLGLKLLDPQLLPPGKLAGWLQPLGGWAPAAFIALLAVRPATLLPGQLLSGLGGVLFGFGPGLIYALVGHLAANTLLYLIARRWGGRLVSWWAGSKASAMERIAEGHAFHVAVATTLNPFLPTDVMLLALSSSRAPYFPLVGGVMLGGFPGTLLTALYGGSVGQGNSMITTVSLIGLLGSLMLGAWLGVRLRAPSV